MRRIVLALSLVAALAACSGGKPQPAETSTTGNATDRSPVNGTSGTTEPAGNLDTAAAVETPTDTTATMKNSGGKKAIVNKGQKRSSKFEVRMKN